MSCVPGGEPNAARHKILPRPGSVRKKEPGGLPSGVRRPEGTPGERGQAARFLEHSGNGVGGVLGLVIYILISPVTFFLVPSEVRYMYEDLDGERSPVSGIYGLWFLLPLIGHLIWFIQVQGALNRYWQAKGAPAP